MNLDDLRATKDAAWSVTKVADLWDLDPRTVRRSCESGQIPSIKVGVRILIPTEYLRQRFCPTPTHNGAEPRTDSATATHEPEWTRSHHDDTLRSA